jgi:hypothetical protein
VQLSVIAINNPNMTLDEFMGEVRGHGSFPEIDYLV